MHGIDVSAKKSRNESADRFAAFCPETRSGRVGKPFEEPFPGYSLRFRLSEGFVPPVDGGGFVAGETDDMFPFGPMPFASGRSSGNRTLARFRTKMSRSPISPRSPISSRFSMRSPHSGLPRSGRNPLRNGSETQNCRSIPRIDTKKSSIRFRTETYAEASARESRRYCILFRRFVF
jgi:hypothetical protein